MALKWIEYVRNKIKSATIRKTSIGDDNNKIMNKSMKKLYRTCVFS